jgi:endoglucanase
MASAVALSTCSGGERSAASTTTKQTEQSSAETPGAQRYPAAPPATASRGVALPIGKCLNYAGQFEVADVADWRRPVVDADFAEIKKAGFDTLRLPVNFARYAGSAPPYTLAEAFLAKVRHVTDAAVAAGLNVIVDNHVEDALYKDAPLGKARMTAIWTQVADAFRDAPPNVWFELLNEPKPPWMNDKLTGLYAPALAAIRKTNPTRPVVYGGEWSSSIGSLATLNFPNDRYLVPTVHYYEPLAFTHQGAPFMTPPFPKGIAFGGPADLARLDEDVAKVKAFMDRTGRVPFVGEYGVYEGVPVAERTRYYDMVSHAFAAIGVQSCAWGYVNDFPIRKADGWIAPIVDAIGTTRR